MTRPLPARLVLLAAAAALAAAMVFSLVVAEHRDFDGGPVRGSGAVSELRLEGLGAAPLAPVSRRDAGAAPLVPASRDEGEAAR